MSTQHGDASQRIAVIGAGGFLGSSLVKAVTAGGYEVLAVVRRSRRGAGDSQIALSAFLTHRTSVHAVILAAGNFRQTPDKLRESQEKLVRTVGKAYPHTRIVFVSSTSVYGNTEGVLREKTPVAPADAYGKAKVRGEAVAVSHHSFASVRLTALYGPGMREELFLPAVIRQARKSHEITLAGDGSRRQNYLHVRDAAALLLKAAESHKNGIFLGAADRSVSNLEVAALVAALVPGTSVRYNGTDSARSWEFDSTYTRHALSWKPTVSLKAGIRELIVHP